MLQRAREILNALSEAEQIAVINAHPRIGERAERVQAQSAHSFREQGYDRDDTPPAVFRELARLNEAYEQKFGFRFVVFVNRRPKTALVPVLEARLVRPRAEELKTALADIVAIAEDRLKV
jgi:2-oxo-4-hydroxy-4-carboxy-5-ureidoimidazoline decarboxylase